MTWMNQSVPVFLRSCCPVFCFPVVVYFFSVVLWSCFLLSCYSVGVVVLAELWSTTWRPPSWRTTACSGLTLPPSSSTSGTSSWTGILPCLAIGKTCAPVPNSCAGICAGCVSSCLFVLEVKRLSIWAIEAEARSWDESLGFFSCGGVQGNEKSITGSTCAKEGVVIVGRSHRVEPCTVFTANIVPFIGIPRYIMLLGETSLKTCYCWENTVALTMSLIWHKRTPEN